MFDGLDDIKWEDFGDTHIAVGVKTYEIPDLIRNLLHENPKERENAIGSLLGRQQHMGMLGTATPYIIPFVLEVLEKHSNYSHRDYVTKCLALMFRQMFTWENFDFMRLSLAVYDAIKAGYVIYKHLLNDSETMTRLYSVRVMSWMQNHAMDALSALMTRLKIESDVEVCQEIIKGIINLIDRDRNIYVWSKEGKAIIKEVYDYLKDKGSFEEKVVFSRQLDNQHFYLDDEIKAFIKRIKTWAKSTGKWDEYN